MCKMQEIWKLSVFVIFKILRIFTILQIYIIYVIYRFSLFSWLSRSYGVSRSSGFSRFSWFSVFSRFTIACCTHITKIDDSMKREKTLLRAPLYLVLSYLNFEDRYPCLLYFILSDLHFLLIVTTFLLYFTFHFWRQL